jgi:hypothetical protein
MRFLLIFLFLLSGSAWAKEIIHVSAQDSSKHQLPALGFSIDNSDAHMDVSLFPEKDSYLILSGPPGGPLSFFLSTTNESDLRKMAAQRFQERPGFQFGSTGSVNFAGQARPCLGFVEGAGLTRTIWCAIYLAPQGTRPAAAAFFGVSAGEKQAPGNGLEVLKHSSLAPLVKTFKFD